MTGLRLQPSHEPVEVIDALAAAWGGRVPLEALLADLNRRGHRSRAPGVAVREAWTFDVVDRLGLRWWPQGITTASDAGDGAPAGRDLVAMAWYAKKLPYDDAGHGSRVTFYDLATARYRHVLLVVPTLRDGVPGVEPLRVHAGGLVWAGDHLHVAATGRGFFTCRLADLLRVPDRGTALGYRYVLPVSSAWRGQSDDAVERLRYSFMSLDRTTASPSLLAGEYTSGGGTRRLVRFALDPATLLPLVDDDGSARPQLLGDGVDSMQGVAAAGGALYVSVSHGRLRPGTVYVGQPGDLRAVPGALPMGPEDLAYRPATDDFLCASEHPWVRWIVRLPRSALEG